MLESEHAIALCDENTYKYAYLKAQLRIPAIVVPSGEKSKSLAQAEEIWKQLIELGAHRKTVLLCIGGGVVTDLGAFVASTFMRGIKFIHIPTSLLAMVDASIGGKCGVNFQGLKNYIGLWSDPKKIILCDEFLQTLPEEELVNGYAEMLKHGLILNDQHYRDCLSAFQSKNIPNNDLIMDSVSIKQRVVEEDYYEKSFRKILNFGHTVGHAIETASFVDGKPIGHGLAVGKGMILESNIAMEIGMLERKEYEQIRKDLSWFDNEVDIGMYPAESMLGYMRKDKKNQSNKINFTLLSSIGKAEINCEVDLSVVMDVLSS